MRRTWFLSETSLLASTRGPMPGEAPGLARAAITDSVPTCIGVDWGTTRLRAYLIGSAGERRK
jgi:hypothetical protein